MNNEINKECFDKNEKMNCYQIPFGVNINGEGMFKWDVKSDSAHLYIEGESGSGKTKLIEGLISHLIEIDDIKIVLANPVEMSISKFRENKKVFVVSKLRELVDKLKDIEFKIDILDSFCCELGIESIPFDGKLNSGKINTVDGYPLHPEILDLYLTSNLGEEEEIDLDDFNLENYLYKYITIHEKNNNRSKRLLITEDNFTTGGDFYFDPTFIVIDEIALYTHMNNYFDDEETLELKKQFDRILNKFLVLGRKYNIHIVISSILDCIRFEKFINSKFICELGTDVISYKNFKGSGNFRAFNRISEKSENE